jgi:hypothetical protein
MLPHPEMVCMLGTRDYQERLRDAERQRLVDSARTGARARPLRAWPARLNAVAWFRAWAARVPGKMRMSRPLTTG